MPSDASSGRVLGLATVGMGLLAGLFYGYACSVMPGLGRADDRTVVDAMQQIDEAIQNPVFFLTFLGAPVLVLCAIALVVTFAFNIPLNDELANAGDPARIADLARVRDDFEGPWVAWNIVRTLATTAAFCCLARALFVHARGLGR
jgi:uncharacterized membrane protein